ncbi:MAG: flavin-nucleotide-binding protein [Rhodobacter sp.]|nr:flavin-nucleotide-binding protein [Rhodobacter sp.]
MSNDLTQTDRSRLRRFHELGAHDRATIHAILDAEPNCTVAYVMDGAPYLTPTLQWRVGERIYWHGSSASRAIKAGKGHRVCLNVTIVDGWVMARSGFNHSVNARSVTLFGMAEVVPEDQKAAHLTAFIEGMWPGRTSVLRPIQPQELKATTLLSMPIAEGSAKVRQGPPQDEPEDYALPIWAGVIPTARSVETPIPDARNLGGLEPPEHITAFCARGRS